MSATRTGHVGDCYEYTPTGKRLAGTDQNTIDGMIALSRQLPRTYHVYSREGLEVWAHAGREIPASALPAAIRER